MNLMRTLTRIVPSRGGTQHSRRAPAARVIARTSESAEVSYLHEAMEVDGPNRLELLFTPCIDQDVHALFLQPLAATEPTAMHVAIQDQAGFHLPPDDLRLPKNPPPTPAPTLQSGAQPGGKTRRLGQRSHL